MNSDAQTKQEMSMTLIQHSDLSAKSPIKTPSVALSGAMELASAGKVVVQPE
jgi:hypothetical protein